MLNDNAWRELMAWVLGTLKEDRKEYVMLSNEVAALRNALQELSGGKFQPLLEKHRRRIEEKAAVAGATDLSDYDEKIRQVMPDNLQ
jgi:hypothetical protein